jgi:cell wall-associated NlpC family hydrolase
MLSMKHILIALMLGWSGLAGWGQEAKTAKLAKTSALATADLIDFEAQPQKAKDLLGKALELTTKNLGYVPGSADPAKGGTDCSGCVYYLLQAAGVAATPRQSNEMYAWTWKAKTFKATNSVTMNTFEWAELKPGNLVFWVNSTADGKTDRDPPVTHVMIYLGKRKSDGQPVLMGASDGRTYQGQSMSGVSVFDFKLPSPGSSSRCIGYASIPGFLEK